MLKTTRYDHRMRQMNATCRGPLTSRAKPCRIVSSRPYLKVTLDGNGSHLASQTTWQICGSLSDVLISDMVIYRKWLRER